VTLTDSPPPDGLPHGEAKPPAEAARYEHPARPDDNGGNRVSVEFFYNNQ